MKTIALTALIALSGTAAFAAKPAAPAWRAGTPLEAVSNTASAITGDLSFHVGRVTKDGKDTLVVKFANDAESTMKPLGKPKGWQGAAVELFALGADPGALLQGNTLCGQDTPATFAALTQTGKGKDAMVELAVYSGKKAPRTHDADSLCGIFNYAPKAN